MDTAEKLKQIERVAALRKNGASYGAIAEELGISSATARTAVKLDEYGKLIFDGSEDNPLRDIVFDSLSTIAGGDLRQRQYIYYITPTAHFRDVQTAVHAVILGISAAISFGYALVIWEEKMIARQQGTANQLLKRAQEDWKTTPASVVVDQKVFGEVHCGSLICQPMQLWIVDPKKPQPSFELKLVFSNGLRRTDIFVRPGGIKNRTVTTKTVEKLVRPYGVRRLYYPKDAVENRKWIRDAVALVLIYLAQEKLIDLDADDRTRGYILDYLTEDYADVIAKGTVAGKVNSRELLSALVLNLLTPKDYRSFRKYVKKTAYGLKIEKHRQQLYALDPDFRPADSGVYDDEPLAIKELRRAKALRDLDEDASEGVGIGQAAQTLGLSERRLYELIQKGKIKTHTFSAGKAVKIFNEDVQRFAENLKTKRQRRKLIDLLAEREQIQHDSASRWVRRQEEKGLTFKQILEKLLDSSTEENLLGNKGRL